MNFTWSFQGGGTGGRRGGLGIVGFSRSFDEVCPMRGVGGFYVSGLAVMYPTLGGGMAKWSVC